MTLPIIRSGLIEAVRDVRSYLETYGVSAPVYFGWKERARTASGPGPEPNRIVIVPSDPTTGKAGPVDLRLKPGMRAIRDENNVVVGHVRALREWHRTFTVVVWAAGSSKSDEEIIEASEDLMEWVIRAFQAAVGGQVSWGEPTWSVSPKELTNGRELVLPGTLRTPIFDVPTETVRGVVSDLEGDYVPTE